MDIAAPLSEKKMRLMKVIAICKGKPYLFPRFFQYLKGKQKKRDDQCYSEKPELTLFATSLGRNGTPCPTKEQQFPESHTHCGH
jgi:hypothetical protein